MDRDHPADPYSPSGSDVNAGLLAGGQGFALAERGARRWAVMIDGLLISLPLLPVVAVGSHFVLQEQTAASAALDPSVPSFLPVLPFHLAIDTFKGLQWERSQTLPRSASAGRRGDSRIARSAATPTRR